MKEDTRERDVREIKGQENFQKGAIMGGSQPKMSHTYSIWLLGYLILEKGNEHEIVDGECKEGRPPVNHKMIGS